MKSETGNDTFTRTRSTWLTLTVAGLLWIGVCVWAFSAVEFDVSADAPNGARHAVQTQEPKRAQARLAQLDAEEKARLNAQVAAAEQRQQAAEAEAAKLARLALEAEEQARLEAQGKAAERRRIAAEEESEMAALKATALAEQKAKRAAKAEALAKQEAQAKAAEARMASEAKVAEEARMASIAKAVEVARMASEAKAAEESKLAAKAKAAEESKLAAEARVTEPERVREPVDARQRTDLTSQSAGVDEVARRAAAAEASRIATLVRQQRSYTSAKGRELGGLVGLSSRLRFAPGSATVSRQTERILDDIFNPLYLYSEASILVSVATNEYDGTTNDGLLSRDRGRAIASYLINRGLEKERFRIHIESGEELSAGTHRVRVSAEEVRK